MNLYYEAYISLCVGKINKYNITSILKTIYSSWEVY